MSSEEIIPGVDEESTFKASRDGDAPRPKNVLIAVLVDQAQLVGEMKFRTAENLPSPRLMRAFFAWVVLPVLLFEVAAALPWYGGGFSGLSIFFFSNMLLPGLGLLSSVLLILFSAFIISLIGSKGLSLSGYKDVLALYVWSFSPVVVLAAIDLCLMLLPMAPFAQMFGIRFALSPGFSSATAQFFSPWLMIMEVMTGFFEFPWLQLIVVACLVWSVVIVCRLMGAFFERSAWVGFGLWLIGYIVAFVAVKVLWNLLMMALVALHIASRIPILSELMKNSGQ